MTNPLLNIKIRHINLRIINYADVNVTLIKTLSMELQFCKPKKSKVGWEVAQWEKHLSCKCKDLSLDLHIKAGHSSMGIRNPSTPMGKWGAEGGESWEVCRIVNLEYTGTKKEEPASNKAEDEKRNPRLSSDLHAHRGTHVCTLMHV